MVGGPGTEPVSFSHPSPRRACVCDCTDPHTLPALSLENTDRGSVNTDTWDRERLSPGPCTGVPGHLPHPKLPPVTVTPSTYHWVPPEAVEPVKSGITTACSYSLLRDHSDRNTRDPPVLTSCRRPGT